MSNFYEVNGKRFKAASTILKQTGTPARARVDFPYQEDMAIALNGAISAHVDLYQMDLKHYKDSASSIWLDWMRRDKQALRTLCRIRRAGRLGLGL